MEYSSMEALADEVDNIQKDFLSMCKDLDTLVESLEGQWQGTAQKEFAVAYSKLRPKLTEIGNVLEKYTKAIKQTVTNEEETEIKSATVNEGLNFGNGGGGNRF